MTGIELWWLGQAGFRLRDATSADAPHVFVDPFLTPGEDRAWQAPLSPDDLGRAADLILCTHEHLDHFDRPSLERAAAVGGARFTLVVPRPLVAEAAALGVPPERVIGAQPGEAIHLPGVRVDPVPARHGVDVADAYTFGEERSAGQVRYLGYVVELGGLQVYHAGDGIPYAGQAQRLRALRVDVALLPINGRDFFRESERNIVGNMDGREAARLAVEMGARVLVPMHWELFANNRGYPGDLAAYVASTFPELTLLLLGRGARVSLLPAPA